MKILAKYTKKKKQNLRRIRRFIKSAEKRGYQFSQELKKSLSSLTTQKLKSLTPEKLYKHSTYQVKSLEGETIDTLTGEQGRKIERTLSAKKAARTRQYKKWQAEIEAGISLSDYQYEDYEEPQEEYFPSFTRIVLDNIEALIAQYEHSTTQLYVHNAYTLEDELNAQIIKYGEDVIAHCCEQAPQSSIAQAEQVIYSSTEEKLRQNLSTFVMIITGEIPSIDEAKRMGETQDKTDVNWMQNGLA